MTDDSHPHAADPATLLASLYRDFTGPPPRAAVSAALCTMYSSWSASRSSVADSRALTAASAAALPLANPSA